MNGLVISKFVARLMTGMQPLKRLKLPTLLEGEALAVWLKLTEEDKEDYSKAKKAIKSKLLPPPFSALNKFNQRTLLPGEALPLFLHDLKDY